MAKKLTYFELNGLGESIRYILHYTGQKFEDVRYDRKYWPEKKPEVQDRLPFGQMPIFEEDSKVLHQSIAIARYVSANTELLPSDPWQQAVLDAAVLTIYDFINNVKAFILAKDPTTKEAVKKKLYDEDIDFFFSRFEKQLKENNGFFGGKLSWADFIFVGIIETVNLYLRDTIEKNYPTITALREKILALPGVKDYVSTRKPYVINW